MPIKYEKSKPDRILSSASGIYFFEEVDSTNDLAKRLLQNKQKPPFILAALRQTKGRGRRGRSFYSPDGGLYLTAVKTLTPEETDESKKTPGLLTCRAAVAAAEAIQSSFRIEVGIKWVNDLIYQDKKVGGILVETVGAANALIIGIGINLSTETFVPELQNKAGTLLTQKPNKAELTAFTEKLGNSLLTYSPPGEVIEKYRTRLYPKGDRVMLSGGKYDGKIVQVLDISTDTTLLVKDEDGAIFTLSDGETRLFSV